MLIVRRGDQYYWASRDDRELVPRRSGVHMLFIEPGSAGYVKVLDQRQVPDRMRSVNGGRMLVRGFVLVAIAVFAARGVDAQVRKREIGVYRIGAATVIVKATSEGHAELFAEADGRTALMLLQPDPILNWLDSARMVVAYTTKLPRGDELVLTSGVISSHNPVGGELQLERRLGGRRPGIWLHVEGPADDGVTFEVSRGLYAELAAALRRAAEETRSLTSTADTSARVTKDAPDYAADADSARPGEDQPYFEFQVERPAVAAGGCSPVYPEKLTAAGVEGEVVAQFVVNADGSVRPGSFKVLKSSHELFTAAVRACVPSLKFLPAEVGGKKVAQVLQQPFQFALQD